MSTNKKTNAVRFSDELQKDVENFADKCGLSVNAAVNFLVSIAVEQIKSGEKEVISRTIFSYDPRKDVDKAQQKEI